MRISTKVSSRRINKKHKKAIKKSGVVSSLFASKLNQHETALKDSDIEIQNLKESIEKAGDMLEKKQSIKNFNIFRDIVSALTKKVTSEALSLQRIGISSWRKRKGDIVVKTIDTELDALYRLIMENQENRLAIIDKVGLLRGLVVDLLL
ncbi:DUF327 family protein [Candidatus Magnetomoraceae bacterium gMMP-15]